MKKLIIFALMAILSTVAFAQDEKYEQAYDLVTEGVKLYDEGNYKEAIKKYDKSIKLYDKYATAYYEKAFALYAMDNLKDAKNVLLQSFKKCEEDESIAMNYKLLADIVDEEGEPSMAVDYYDKALGLVSDDSFDEQHSIANNLGVTYERLAGLETDSAEVHLSSAAACFVFSLTRNPQHAGSYYGYYNAVRNSKLPASELNYYNAFSVIGWYGFFGGNHPRIGVLADIPETWATVNLTEEDLAQFGPLNKLIYRSAHEVAEQETSEYGKLYDMLMYITPKVTENITNEPVPLPLAKEDIFDESIWPLYAKMLREGVFETFCHVVATRVEKNSAANVEWLSKNEESQQKLLDLLNGGRYFDKSLLEEQIYGKVPSVTTVASAEDAHARNEEALQAIKYYYNHYVGSEEMKQTAQFILRWTQASHDVNVPIGPAEAKWLSEETVHYLVAYVATCAQIEMESGSKDLTEKQYMQAVNNVLWYYRINKEQTGKNDELERLSNLDEESFAKEMKASYKAHQEEKQEQEYVEDAPEDNDRTWRIAK